MRTLLLYSVPAGICLLMTAPTLGQDTKKAHFWAGFRAGATQGRIEDLATTMIRSEWYAPESYRVEARQRRRLLVGGYLDIKPLENVPFRIEIGVDYEHAFSRTSDDFEKAGNYDFTYQDWYSSPSGLADSLRYKIWLNYSYLDITLMPKAQLLTFGDRDKNALTIGIGASAGFNVTPEDIDYLSNHPSLGPDVQIRQNLANTLKGTSAFWLVGGLELTWGPMDVCARYRRGVKDLVRTEANSYNFVENQNSGGDSFLVGVGIHVDLKPVRMTSNAKSAPVN